MTQGVQWQYGQGSSPPNVGYTSADVYPFGAPKAVYAFTIKCTYTNLFFLHTSATTLPRWV